MDRELLLELGCEELPASWLPGLTRQIGERFAARLAEARLTTSGPVETYSTPRRLTVRVERISERQTDFEDTTMGPPVSAAFKPDGEPTPAAIGFARKQGVDVAALERVETPKGTYLAHRRQARSKAAVDVLPDVLGQTLRDLQFPKQMRWDALLEDGRGELVFGRPIRWILYLYGGRVIPFVIARTAGAQSTQVQDVRSGAVTYGHRFLATSGRAGRAIKVRSFDDYRARLAEHFVVLDRSERHDRIARELDVHARRLGGRVMSGLRHSVLLQEVPDLVEYPSVVAGTFTPDFLDLPEEVLTVTMIHHQHYFPVVSDEGHIKPAFLAVTNTQSDNAKSIARNAERVLTARLRDARFFWHADRQATLESRLDRLATLLFHKKAGSYRAKAERIERLARWIAGEVLGAADVADHAAVAARLAKADLTTDMVRELTELQGTMGGIYAREEGQPEAVWKAIYHQYEPIGVSASEGPAKRELGSAALSWAAVALADRLDTLVSLISAGEQPTGSRDPYGLRRSGNGIVKILVDAPGVLGVEEPISLTALLDKAWECSAISGSDLERGKPRAFMAGRIAHLLKERGFRHDEAAAAIHAIDEADAPLNAYRRAEALRDERDSKDFAALAELFKRAKNITKGVAAEPAGYQTDLLTEPAEWALHAELERRRSVIEGAVAAGRFRAALTEAAQMKPAVAAFFDNVRVLTEDAGVRHARLQLLAAVRDLIMRIADLSQIGEEEVSLDS